MPVEVGGVDGLGHVDPPPTLVVVGCGFSCPVGAGGILPGHVVGAGGEDGLHQRGGRIAFAEVFHQVFEQKG